MELCQKETLDGRLATFNLENRILNERLNMMNWFQDLCSAIEHTHNCGYIHRDIKPSNILFNQRGTLKLGDFGLARDSAYQTLTLSVGTKLYVSPEQLTGSKYNTSTDFYPLGKYR